MSWIDVSWAILTLLSVIIFILGKGVSQYKIRVLNYVMIVFIIIYCAEIMQTLTHMTMTGYLFRMLTWTIQAAFIAISVYHTWLKPWLKHHSKGIARGEIVISLILMSCLGMLVLK